MKLTPTPNLGLLNRYQTPVPSGLLDGRVRGLVLTGFVTVMRGSNGRWLAGRQHTRTEMTAWFDLMPGFLGVPGADMSVHWRSAVRPTRPPARPVP